MNWCPFDKTVLANEQVVGGECERCGTPVEQRFLEQWFFRITDYAGRLLANLDRLDWSESTLTAQRNWIGKSEGAEIVFPVQDVMAYAGSATVNAGSSGEVTATPLEIRVFTTRPDTLFGATYLVLAPEHPLVAQIAADEQRQAVDAYVARAAKQDLVARKTSKEKTGAFTGAYATNPGDRAADPDLDRRLRADGVRHGGDHGGARPRRARLRVRARVRSADRARGGGRRPVGRHAARRGVRRDGRVRAGEFGALRRAARRRGADGDRHGAGGAPCRASGGELPAARLVHLAPALLGPADPDRLLRRRAVRARAGGAAAGRAARDRGLPAGRFRREPAGAARGVVPHPVPAVRQARAARDGRERHLPRQRVVLPALSELGARRRPVRSRS